MVQVGKTHFSRLYGIISVIFIYFIFILFHYFTYIILLLLLAIAFIRFTKCLCFQFEAQTAIYWSFSSHHFCSFNSPDVMAFGLSAPIYLSPRVATLRSHFIQKALPRLNHEIAHTFSLAFSYANPTEVALFKVFKILTPSIQRFHFLIPYLVTEL